MALLSTCAATMLAPGAASARLAREVAEMEELAARF